ncbi:MAG: DUF1080 domain-containing protein, partial [Burkholderiaceae bacterium]
TALPLAAAALALALTACAPMMSSGGIGWQPLFDGNSLNGWKRVGDGNWRVEGGAIVADAKTGKDNGFLVTPQSYKDFEIRAEFWSSPDANSGIFVRCADPTTITDQNCYEANIFDTRPEPKYGTGAIVNVAEVNPMPKTNGGWNTYLITVRGTELTLVLNGVQTVKVNDRKLASGPIALQYASGVVKFRKVEIRPL